MGSIEQRIENNPTVCQYTMQEVTIQIRKHGILDVELSKTCNKHTSSCPKTCPYANENK